jgi:hypothetical protein
MQIGGQRFLEYVGIKVVVVNFQALPIVLDGISSARTDARYPVRHVILRHVFVVPKQRARP